MGTAAMAAVFEDAPGLAPGGGAALATLAVAAVHACAFEVSGLNVEVDSSEDVGLRAQLRQESGQR